MCVVNSDIDIVYLSISTKAHKSDYNVFIPYITESNRKCNHISHNDGSGKEARKEEYKC